MEKININNFTQACLKASFGIKSYLYEGRFSYEDKKNKMQL